MDQSKLGELLGGFPAAQEVFLNHRLNHELVLAFLMAFARAEHALKKAGFADARNGGIFICWDRFARELGNKALMTDDSEVKAAIEYLTGEPPKKQTLDLGGWKKRSPQSWQEPAEFLVQSIKTVRNNLFHGGKEMRGKLVERDEKLIRLSLLVLRHLITAHEGVREAFQETGPAHAG